MTYDPLFVAFLIYFNRDRDYFECHEVLEELWLKRGREPLYQGLLQVAVGLFHIRRGNVTGGRKMLMSAAGKLAPYPQGSLGIDLDRLRSDLVEYLSRLDRFETEPFVYYDLNIALIDAELARSVAEASPQLSPNVPQQQEPRRGEKHAERERIMKRRNP